MRAYWQRALNESKEQNASELSALRREHDTVLHVRVYISKCAVHVTDVVHYRQELNRIQQENRFHCRQQVFTVRPLAV